MNNSKKVLIAIAAHADDAEINAGGLLAKWAAAGGQIHILMATNNCSGPMIPDSGDEHAKRRLGPLETHCIRHREQDAAAALLSAKMHYLNYYQRHYWNGREEVHEGYTYSDPLPEGLPHTLPILIACNEPDHMDRLAAMIGDLKPDLVLTQTPADRDPEHHAVAAMVWESFLRNPELQRVPLRFWSSSTASPGGLLDPHYDHIEDISDTYGRKLELCACHASQMTARRYDVVTRRAAYWGRRIGVAYAEPFRSAHWGDML